MRQGNRAGEYALAGGAPQNQRNLATGLEPFVGEWTPALAAHLLRRTTFGVRGKALTDAAKMTMAQIISKLFESKPLPQPPLDPTTGKTFVDITTPIMNDFQYQRYVKGWWLLQMYNEGINIRETMTLFWHNHFSTEADVVADSRLSYQYLDVLRKNSVGNIKALTKDITINSAMLYYLNGNLNTAKKPNENYGRELLELFTIGKGVEITQGNYTNYTEDDVREAAKVLTGWTIVRSNSLVPVFNAGNHDSTDKKFSSAFQNTVIKGKTGANAGKDEISDLVEMIFKQEETSRYICRKLYRWFVWMDVDAATETNVIEPMAAIYRQNNYDIRPALEALFSSAHFYDMENIGAMIKHPITFLMEAIAETGVPIPDYTTKTADFYTLANKFIDMLTNLQMNPLDPPSVAGWQAYYQTPDFQRLWINTATLPNRNGYTDQLVSSGGRGINANFNVITYTQGKVSDMTDPRGVITALTTALFPIPISETAVEFILANVFLPNQPDYEWGQEWGQYVKNPTNQSYMNNVKNKLTALLKYAFRMAEYQLH